MNKEFIIIAPHADDEIIGCWVLLQAEKVRAVAFASSNAMEEAKASSIWFGFPILHIDELEYDDDEVIYMFPDHIYELHPLHRKLGAIGETLLRSGKCEVWFYTTNMNTPYIHTLSEDSTHNLKLFALNQAYPNKKSLWEYDHKYFLFEGYTKWIMKWND